MYATTSSLRTHLRFKNGQFGGMAQVTEH
jgi:hypothetical protein